MSSQSEITSTAELTNSKPDHLHAKQFTEGEKIQSCKNNDSTTIAGTDKPSFSNAENFSKKFLKQFEPDLKKMENKIDNVNQNQCVLIESLCQETEKLKSSDAVKEIETAMNLIQSYRVKLQRIKKNMLSLKDTSQRLKRDVEKLQQQKQKEELKKEELKRKAMAEEKKLAAQFSPNND